MNILLQTTQPSGWNDPSLVIGALVTGIATLGTLILSIIALFKSGGAQTTATEARTTASTAQASADANSKAISSTQADVRSVNEQLTAVATSTPTPDLLAATKKAPENQP